MSSQPLCCHLPSCSEAVSLTLPRKLGQVTYAFCLEHKTLLPGTEQDKYLCNRHYNVMYTNPAKAWRKSQSDDTSSLPRKRSRTNLDSALDPTELDKGNFMFSA